jgi:hypothetical protein
VIVELEEPGQKMEWPVRTAAQARWLAEVLQAAASQTGSKDDVPEALRSLMQPPGTPSP